MATEKYTPEIQAKMIAWLLRKEIDPSGRYKPLDQQTGIKLFKHFHKVDSETFAQTFSFSGMGAIISVVGEHWQKFKDLPSREIYHSVKLNNLKYQKWKNDAKEKDQRQMIALEESLFVEHPDSNYIEAQVVEFITRSFLIQIARQEAECLVNQAKTPLELAKWGQDERKKFMESLEEDLSREGTEGEFLLRSSHDIRTFEDVEPLKTKFNAIRLYWRGLTVLVAPPKSFKTGLSQNVAIDLMYAGCDVLFIDLENGLTKMIRRFCQALINCPKEWLYAGKWVNVDEIGIDLYEPNKRYSKGDRVIRVDAEYEVGFNEETQKEIKKWRITPAIWEAIKDGAEYVEDWEEVDQDLAEHVWPTQEILDTAIEDIRQETGGDIRLENIRGCTVEMLTRIVKAYVEGKRKGEDETDWFYSGKRPRVLIIDWGQHVLNKNPKLNYWEKIRDNYAQYKILREMYDLHMLVIEAPKEYSKLSDPLFNPYTLTTAGTGNIMFDAESVAVVLATDEEKQKGYRRIVMIEDRDSPRLTDYIKIDYESFRAWKIEAEEHHNALPELWEIWDKGVAPEKKGRNARKDTPDKIREFQISRLGEVDDD